MNGGAAAIVGAAESTNIGVLPGISNFQLNVDAALNALADACLGPRDIDGLACGYVDAGDLAAHLGIRPAWIDTTVVGGCSWLNQLRHAVAALAAGLCTNAVIVHGESGRSRVGGPHHNFGHPGSHADQFVFPYAYSGPVTALGLPAVRYMRRYGLREEDLANVAVTHRLWAQNNFRAFRQGRTSVQEVLASPMIAWPFRRLMCCVVTDGGAALVLTSRSRAYEFRKPPVFVLGCGESLGGYTLGAAGFVDPIHADISVRSCGAALKEAGVQRSDIEHLMIYDAFVHLPLFGLEALGFVAAGEAAQFLAEGHTSPGGDLPMNTNGGGLCYTHTGSYGMFMLQEAVRQLRGEAVEQVPGVELSLCHGWGGCWSAAATVILSREPSS